MNQLLQRLSGRRIAIVGNGRLKEDKSAEIDAADVVMRFNHFYNYDSGKVGKRVDIVMQTITPMYYDAANRHDAVVRAQKPEVYLVKNHFTYDTNLHKVYGGEVKVENTTRWFDAYPKYTTGTTVLAFLADHLDNAEVRCYGFQDEEDWQRYLATDAKNFRVAPEERKVMMDSIKKLESLTITEASKSVNYRVVIPVKQYSSGAPGKNRVLLPRCIEEAKKAGYPITVVGDDYELLHKAATEYGVEVCPLRHIDAMRDVTDTLREWRTASGYSGFMALVQCTSPKMKAEWIKECFDALKYAPVVATATELTFKPTAIYHCENGVYVRSCQAMPQSSVARQLLPHAVRINGAVEAFHTDALELASFYDAGVLKPVVVDEADSLDVDTEADLRLVASV